MSDTPARPSDSPHARFQQLLDHVENYLAAQQEEGVTRLPATPALVDALRKPLPPPPPAAGCPETPAARLAAIAEAARACTACPLHRARTQAVPGQGHPHPDILFVGEGPGADEDRQGLAFVGAAGHLLTKMIAAMGLTRDEVFIANIVKCRPPGNRAPQPEEAAACLPFLLDQIAILQPRVIITLGATALKYLIGLDQASVTRMRGTWLTVRGIDLMPTFHPAFLLRQPARKREAWDDLKAVLARLGRTPPPMPR